MIPKRRHLRLENKKNIFDLKNETIKYHTGHHNTNILYCTNVFVYTCILSYGARVHVALKSDHICFVCNNVTCTSLLFIVVTFAISMLRKTLMTMRLSYKSIRSRNVLAAQLYTLAFDLEVNYCYGYWSVCTLKHTFRTSFCSFPKITIAISCVLWISVTPIVKIPFV